MYYNFIYIYYYKGGMKGSSTRVVSSILCLYTSFYIKLKYIVIIKYSNSNI